VSERLFRLWLDAVIRRDNQHDDVRHPGTARAHRAERLVTWRVEEGDLLAPLLDLIRADVLGDATRLTCSHPC